MADASALGADGSNPMEVQVLSSAPFDSSARGGLAHGLRFASAIRFFMRIIM